MYNIGFRLERDFWAISVTQYNTDISLISLFCLSVANH
jgi:hypothetical protein